MKRTNKKGFTIVELVIVIAVIAILAAVLIPNISRLVKKANESSDIQAVRNMNTFLAAEGVTGDVNSIFDVYDLFEDSGYDVDSYSPLYSGRHFYYDKQYNQVLYIETDGGKVLFPEERKSDTWDSLERAGHDLLSLSMEAPKGQPPTTENYSKSGNKITATVTNGAEYVYVINEYNTSSDVTSLDLTINGTVNLYGGQCIIEKAKANGTVEIKCAENGTAIIKNVTAKKFTTKSSVNSLKQDAKYGSSALIGKTEGKSSVTITGITIENANLKNVECGGMGFLVGQGEGNATITIDSVTIQDSTIIGHRNVGAFVGYVGDNSSLTIQGTNTLKNVNVKTVGGKSALLIGYVGDYKNVTVENNTTVDCDSSTKLSIYKNAASEQKFATGTPDNCPAEWSSASWNSRTTIIGQEQFVYSVKTKNESGTNDYTVYGFRSDAWMLGNAGNYSTTERKIEAFTTLDEIKNAKNK